MIKRRFIDIGLGFLLFLLVMIVEFLVTLPFGTPDQGMSQLRGDLNREFLLTAAPALVLSALVALAAHTRSTGRGLSRGLTWLVVIGALYLAIGLGKATTVMFATVGMWLTLVAVVGGAVLGGWLGGRRKPGTARQTPGANDSAPLRTRLT